LLLNCLAGSYYKTESGPTMGYGSAHDFQLVVESLVSHDKTTAECLLRGIVQTSTKNVRASVPLRRKLAIYKRDSYTCRYCDTKTIVLPVFELIAKLLPETNFLYNDFWKAGCTDLAISNISTCCDHVVPASPGGSNEPSNLVTACATCNYVLKGSSTDWEYWEQKKRPIVPSSWDGLTGHFAALVTLAGQENVKNFRDWSEAIRTPECITSIST
jgi:5-methylcytosine-specific restriction endonuclease McrA